VNIQRLPDDGKLYDRESTSAAVDTTCHLEIYARAASTGTSASRETYV
jgi:hypothetical protein